MRILLCEDDLPFRDFIRGLILETYTYTNLNIHEVSSLEALGQALNEEPDLAILDIRLPDGKLTDHIYELRQDHPHFDLIFMSSLEGDFVTIADARPFGFIDKTESLEEIEGKLTALLATWAKSHWNRPKFSYRSQSATYLLDFKDIYYFEKEGRVFTPHLRDQAMPNFYATTAELLDMLQGQNFIALGHSFVVNQEVVQVYLKETVHLINGAELPISKAYRKSVSEKALSFIKEGGEECLPP